MRGVGRRFGLMSKECSRTGRVEDPGSRRKGRSTAHQANTPERHKTSFSRSCFWWSLPTLANLTLIGVVSMPQIERVRETTASQGKTRREQGNAMAYVPLYQDRRPGYVS